MREMSEEFEGIASDEDLVALLEGDVTEELWEMFVSKDGYVYFDEDGLPVTFPDDEDEELDIVEVPVELLRGEGE